MQSIPRLFFFIALVFPTLRLDSATTRPTEVVGPVVTPRAAAQTTPVPHAGDAADDPAIWIHPSLPELSLILGTDKQGGLHVYDMDGSERQIVSRDCHPDNVDVLYGFPLRGRRIDIAVAGVRSLRSPGVKVWAIDPESRKLRDVTAGGVIQVFGATEPYGTCVYRSPRDGTHYFFANNKQGKVEQYRLEADGRAIRARKTRSFSVPGMPEGCVADNELGWFYISEENRGIWKFAAEPDAPAEGKLIARVGEHGLVADVEGLTLYYASGGRGYLIASSQGNNTFKVYERQGNNGFVLTIDPQAGTIDDVNDTDGIDVTNRPTSARFPKGFFIVQDGSTPAGRQNFKIYSWEEIGGQRLIIDTEYDPRRVGSAEAVR